MAGTYIHGIAASEAVDTANEILKIDGLDISTLDKDGVFNYEHQSSLAGHVVGKVLYAKKIFSEDDCSNPLEKHFWNKVKLPFLYVVGELFDGVGHQQASEVAAMLRYDAEQKKSSTKKNLVNFSIEGAKLETKKGIIKEAIARKVTITTHPANKSCVAELLSPQEYQMYISSLVKSENVTNDLFKAYSLGSLDVAPSDRTGGSAIVKAVSAQRSKKKILSFLQKKFRINKSEAVYVAKYFLKKHLAEHEMYQAYEELSKAKYDKLFPEEQRADIRADRYKAHRDMLEEELTSEPGVSHTGIEVRRASKSPEFAPHGYARVSTPDYHKARAIKMIKQKIKAIRNFIEKNEFKLGVALQKGENAKKTALDRYKQYMGAIIDFYHKKQEPIRSSVIFQSIDGMPHYHPDIHPAERLAAFKEVAQEKGLHPEYPIKYDHDHSMDHMHFEGVDKGQPVKISWEMPKQVKMAFKQKPQEPASSSKMGAYDRSIEGYGGPVTVSAKKRRLIKGLSQIVALSALARTLTEK